MIGGGPTSGAHTNPKNEGDCFVSSNLLCQGIAAQLDLNEWGPAAVPCTAGWPEAPL